MFQDDRMMSILSGIVLMVAIGTVVQKSEQLQEWFSGSGPRSELVADQAATAAGDLTRIDVLANDRELDASAAGRLVITAKPACGRVFVQAGALQYLADESCVGEQRFAYGLHGGDLDPAVVELKVGRGKRREDLAIASAPPPSPEPAPAREPPAERLALADTEPGTPAPAGAAGPGLATVGPSAGAAVTAPVPDEIAIPSEPADPATGSPAVPLHPSAPGSPAPSPIIPGQPSIGGADSVVLSPDTAPPSSAAPSRIEAAAVAGGVGRVPGVVLPRTDLAGLSAPSSPAVHETHGVAAVVPVPLARPEPPAAAETAPGPGAPAAGLPRTPRPGVAVVPGAPGQPGEDEEFALAAAPAAGAKWPSGVAPTLPIMPADVGMAAVVPERLDTDPLDADALDGSEPAPGIMPPHLASIAFEEDVGFREAGQLLPDGHAAREIPAALGATSEAGFARYAVPDASVEPEAGGAWGMDLSPDRTRVERGEPPAIGTGEDATVALADPGAGLGPARELGQALRLAPVDTPEPAPLAAAPAAAPVGDTAPADAEPAVAALTPANGPCAVPPGITLEPDRGAITAVHVASPCHAGTAAVLAYGELSLGVAIGPDGKGSIAVPGFEPSMEAMLTFADGTALGATLPFQEIDMVERVAIAWDLPVRLDLHALEFGAEEGGAGHVRPDNPRSLEEVRRSGGGFLHEFTPIDGAGDFARVYTYYLRRGGPTGIVKLMIDFASRRAAESGTCGGGDLASPGFTVVRTARGLVERPTRSRVAALDCDLSAGAGEEMIGNAVGDLVITY